jgi:hypothetical protein
MGDLTVEDFKVSMGRVYQLNIQNNTHFYLLILGIDRIVRS